MCPPGDSLNLLGQREDDGSCEHLEELDSDDEFPERPARGQTGPTSPDRDDAGTNTPAADMASGALAAQSSPTNLTKKEADSSPPRLRLQTNGEGDITGLSSGQGDEESDEFSADLASTLGTPSVDRANELLCRLIDLTSFVESVSRRELVINRILAMLHERGVESPMEAMQCIQMLVADQLQHQMARKAMAADHLEQTEFYLKWCKKFQDQTNHKIESLQDMKGEPEQRIRVERVEIDQGGQAVLGNFQPEDQDGGG